ncbi:MAG TPA: DEAD/DEAH box helicase, partial [Chroococcales cyanobacterium]
IKWRSIFLDEAQAIKNHLTQTNQVACKLKADYRVCMTGTPVENNLGELWSLFNFLMPGLFGTRTEFRASFQRPIEEFDNQEAKERLTERLKPFLLRRTKDQVACELPKKTVMVKFFELEGDQRDLYETVRVHMLEKVRNAIATKGLVRSRIVILDAILKLRQVCCDPRLLRLPAAQNVKSSAKLFLLREMLSQLMEEGRKVLLFSQFTSMLDLIVNEVNAMNVQYVELRGTTTDRKTPVEQFQKGKVPLFMISLRAGGTGLNLTAADTVIHYDPWWNPAVEDQATDRAYRIGQDKPVFVYKLIGLGTIEEKLLEMQGRKRKFANAIYDDSSCSVDITEEDIESLFAPLAQSESSGLASNDD